MNDYHIHALHGFLGHPNDWPTSPLLKNFHAYDLLNDFPIISFDAWAPKFNESISAKSHSASNNILLGYSLGGRLALHALLQAPDKWKAAIIVSTHPGLTSHEEKHQRIAADELWAKKFEHEPWEEVIKAWNAQDVFKHSVEFNREESDNDCLMLSKAMKTWSLGKQKNLTDEINSLNVPIYWMVGENDKKFLLQAEKFNFKHPKSKICVVSQAGHRLPFDQPKLFLSNVTNFIQQLE